MTAELSPRFGTSVGPGLTLSRPWRASAVNSGSGNFTLKGVDPVAGAVYAVDTGGGTLRRSADGGTTWSNSLTLPTDVTYNHFGPVIRAGDSIYNVSTLTSTGVAAIFKGTVTTGNTSPTWTKVQELTAGATTPLNGFSTDGTYIYLGEYGNPVGGPSLWRASVGDGTTWTKLNTWATSTHIHDVQPDPDNPGHLYIAMGDGVPNANQFSDDYGATWTPLATLGTDIGQLTSLSFSPTHVWATGDDLTASVLVVNKATKRMTVASTELHTRKLIQPLSGSKTWDPPSVADGAATTTTVTVTGAVVGMPCVATLFNVAQPAGVIITAQITAANTATVTLANLSGATQDIGSGVLMVTTVPILADPDAFYGIYDRTNGVFYFSTPSSTNYPRGALYAMWDKGTEPVLITSGENVGPFAILNGKLFTGQVNRPLITKASGDY